MAAKDRSQDPRRSIRRHTTPEQPLVSAAYKEGHIDLEQAKDLNPKYDPNKRYNLRSRSEFRKQKEERKSSGKPPSLLDTHEAVVGRKVSFDQAVDLNPKYGDKEKRLNTVREAKKVRNIDTPVASYRIPTTYNQSEG